MGKILKVIMFFTGFFLVTIAGQAQCAMCRATLENNLSNGDIGPGANINVGILYLFVFPYILIGVAAFFWYRHSKKSQKLQHDIS